MKDDLSIKHEQEVKYYLSNHIKWLSHVGKKAIGEQSQCDMSVDIKIF